MALERFRLLTPHLEQKRSLARIAAEAGIPYRTAQRWLWQYQKFGLAGLARKDRADRGRRQVSAKIEKIIEGLALQKPPLPLAALHRHLQCFARQDGQRCPSYKVVRNIVRGLPADLLTLAHHGTKAYSDAFELIHRREASQSNAIWQADHCLLDVLVIGPKAKPQKPWLTVIMDDYSRAVAGYFLSFDAPSAIQTSLALRQAIWRKNDPHWNICGIPDVLYTDNGSDFTSHHLEQVSADLKMRLVFSIPGRPRGRGRIERFFSTVTQMFLCELPGYAPPTGGMRGKPTLTLAELGKRFHKFLLETYHRRRSRETKASPAERWEKDGFLPRLPDSLEALDLLLLTVAKARKVHPDGIHLHGLRYIDTALAAYVGESVVLRFDPRDLGEIRVFYKNRFLCRAISAELAGATVSLRDILRARSQRRGQLRTILRDHERTVDELLELKRGDSGPPSEAEDPEPLLPPKKHMSSLKRYRNE
jgi:putative transposase